MAAVATVERVEFECARCDGTVDRSTNPRTCPHCHAKKADRCQICDRATYIGTFRCPDHLAPTGRPTAMLPPAPPPPHAQVPTARWAPALARAAIAVSLIGSAGFVIRNQTKLRDARSFPELGAMVVPDAGARYEQVDDVVAGTGPVDLDKAVSEDVEGPASRQAMTDAGFVRGFSRLWRAGDAQTESVRVEVFQYSTHTGAVADVDRLDRVVPAVAAGHKLAWTTFNVRSVPAARGYSLVDQAGGASVEVVAFARGQYGVAVTVTSSDRDTARARAVAIAEDQRAKLSKAEPIERLVTDGLRTIRG
jgi:hypothetical protein